MSATGGIAHRQKEEVIEAPVLVGRVYDALGIKRSLGTPRQPALFLQQCAEINKQRFGYSQALFAAPHV